MGSFSPSRPRMRAGTQRLRLLAQHPTLVLSSVLLLLLALDMYNVGMIMPHYTYHHYRYWLVFNGGVVRRVKFAAPSPQSSTMAAAPRA